MKSPYLPPESDVNLTSTDEEKDLSSPFSAKGRFGRLSYIAWNALLLTVMVILLAATMSLLEKNILLKNDLDLDTYVSISLLLISIIAISTVVIALIFLIRRLHDLDMNGWWSLVQFIPFVGGIFMLYVMLKKGDEDSNRFAPARTTALWENIIGGIAAILGIVFTIVAVIGTII